MSWWILLILLLLSLSAGSGQQVRSSELIKSFATESAVYNLCMRARSLMDAGKFAQAKDVLTQAAKEDPTSYSRNIHRNLFQCYRQLKQFDNAVAEGRKLYQLDPQSADAIYDLAMVYYQLDRFDEAADFLRKYIATSTDSASKQQAEKLIREILAYSNMQNASRKTDSKHFAEAKVLLEKAASYDPSPYSGAIHAHLCYVLHELGQSAQAVVEGKRALKLMPSDEQTMYTLALSYSDLSEFDEAINWLNKYIAVEQDARRKADAQLAVNALADDRSQYDSAENKLPDYLNSMRKDDQLLMWSQKRLPLKVAIMSGAGVVGYRPTFPALVKRALDVWCEASGKKLDYRMVSDLSDADIIVSWTKEPINFNANHPGTRPVGLTTVSAEGAGLAQRAEIAVRTVSPFNPNRILDDGEFSHVVIHEVGHALGLGHSKCITDVMYFRSAKQQSGPPTPRDRATIARLYADYPVVAFVPKVTAAGTPTRYSPPPVFLPPAIPDSGKLMPPMFLPPPIDTDDEKLSPPMFVPPPLPDAKEKISPKVPFFTPPPLEAPAKVEPKKIRSRPQTLFFTPPPVR